MEHGFNDFYSNSLGIENIKIEDKSKINILIAHGSLNESDKQERQYNPISEKMLEELGFDYIALGHIHKPYYNEKENQRIIYPGSTISLGFDELGDHGMIIGEVEKNKTEIKFIKLDNKNFIEKEIDVSEINSEEELIEYLINLNNKEININNNYIKIILTGKRNFEINLIKIIKLINQKNILKIKNKTKMKYNIEEVSRENNLRGMFVKQILRKESEGQYDKKTAEEIIEIGLDAIEDN